GLGGELAGLLGDQLPRLVQRVVAAEELVDQPQTHGELVGGAVVHREDAVLVAGEIGEAVDVLPHALVGGVEQVRAVLVDLDPGLGLGLRVGVAADVVAPLEHQDALAELAGRPLGDRQTEESRPHHDEVIGPPLPLVRHRRLPSTVTVRRVRAPVGAGRGSGYRAGGGWVQGTPTMTSCDDTPRWAGPLLRSHERRPRRRTPVRTYTFVTSKKPHATLGITSFSAT